MSSTRKLLRQCASGRKLLLDYLNANEFDRQFVIGHVKKPRADVFEYIERILQSYGDDMVFLVYISPVEFEEQVTKT